KEDEKDAAAWFNLGLARAWLGDNRTALEALDRYVSAEADENRAAEGAALAMVLRQGQGMDDVTDFLENAFVYQVRDMQSCFGLLDEGQRDRRFVPFQVNQEQQLITGLILEKKPALTPELAASQVSSLGAYVLIIGDHMRLWHTNVEALDKARDEVRQRLGAGVNEGRAEKAPASFNDLLADVLGFPLQATDEARARELVIQHSQRYFEETWIHRPLKSLGGIPPVDAAGSAPLRKKLRGVVQFLQECSA